MGAIWEEEVELRGQGAGDVAGLVGMYAAIGGEAVEAEDSEFAHFNLIIRISRVLYSVLRIPCLAVKLRLLLGKWSYPLLSG